VRLSGHGRRRLCVVGCTITGLVLAVPGLPAAEAVGTTVTIKNRQYNPDPVTVAVGDTITWSNASDEDHNVRGGPFNSPALHPGNTFSFTFDKKGTIRYVCDFHPTMKGTITVV
jgi:plastocyanin